MCAFSWLKIVESCDKVVGSNLNFTILEAQSMFMPEATIA